jgi:hypothetical protein
VVAVSPDATYRAGTPARTSIRYCSAAAGAAPPGTIRPKALPASWEHATVNQLPVRRAMRWSCQIEAKQAASNSRAATIHSGRRSNSSRHEVKTSSRLGISR